MRAAWPTGERCPLLVNQTILRVFQCGSRLFDKGGIADTRPQGGEVERGFVGCLAEAREEFGRRGGQLGRRAVRGRAQDMKRVSRKPLGQAGFVPGRPGVVGNGGASVHDQVQTLVTRESSHTKSVWLIGQDCAEPIALLMDEGRQG